MYQPGSVLGVVGVKIDSPFRLHYRSSDLTDRWQLHHLHERDTSHGEPISQIVILVHTVFNLTEGLNADSECGGVRYTRDDLKIHYHPREEWCACDNVKLWESVQELV